MAFNPFEAFRRNSKALLALLTIFIMFVFILSSGIGGGMDFFDWLSRNMGGTDSRGPKMGEIDGREYHDKELQEIRTHRAAANTFMLTAVQRADFSLMTLIEQDIKNNLIRDEQVRKSLERVSLDRSMILQNGAAYRFEGGRIEVKGAQELEREALRDVARLNERESAAEIRNLRRAARVYNHASQLVANARSGLFFGQIANQNAQDALQFLMYLKEADRLGIKLTDEDVKKLINEETEGVLNDQKTAEEVDAEVRKHHKLSPDKIIEAIGLEYRVRTALAIVRGWQTSPATQSPYEMFEYFKDRCTPIKYDVFDLSIEKYLPLVQGEPTPEEIAALYDQFARVEPDPTRPTPGFKEPRKIVLQFIGIDDSLPVYKQAYGPVRAATSVGLSLQGLVGGDAFSTALLATEPVLVEPLLARDQMLADFTVQRIRDGRVFNRTVHGRAEMPATLGVNIPNEIVTLYLSARFLEEKYYSRDFPRAAEMLAYHPLPLASLAGHLAVVNSPVSAMTLSVGGLANTTTLLDIRARTAFGVQAALGPIPSNPAFVLTTPFAALANLPTLSDAFYMATYLENQRLEKVYERRFASKDLDRLEEKLFEIRKKLAPPEDKDKKDPLTPPKKKDAFKPKPEDVKKANDEARELVAQFIKDRTSADKDKPSIRTGQSEIARDQFDIPNDPGLKVLTDRLRDTRKYEPYQAAFFGRVDPKEDLDAKLYTPREFAGTPQSGNFSEPNYLAWRIEDKHGEVIPFPKASQAMKDQVVRAWKIRKARELANEDAKRLAEKLKAIGQKYLVDSDNRVGYETERREIEFSNEKWKVVPGSIEIAPLTQELPFHQMPNMKPTFNLPTIKNSEIVYPLSTQPEDQRDMWNGREMARQMLEVRSKPLGETVVVSDTPNMHIYVCVMVDKRPVGISEFYQVFRHTIAPDGFNFATGQRAQDYFYRPFVRDGDILLNRDMINRVKGDVKYSETEDLKKALEKRDQ